MEELRLLAVPIDEYFTLKARDIIIDKIEIEGYDSLVSKGVEQIIHWQEVENPYIRRKNRLLSIIHSKEEIEDIVKGNLDYFLKGYEYKDKRGLITGESFDLAEWLWYEFTELLERLSGIPGLGGLLRDIGEFISDLFPHVNDFGYDDYDTGDYDDMYGPIPAGVSDYADDSQKPYSGGTGQSTPPPVPPMTPYICINSDSDDGSIVDISVKTNRAKKGVISNIDAGFAAHYNSAMVKSLTFTATKDQSKEKKEAVNELLTDYMLMTFEAEGRLSIVEDNLRRLKSDKLFQRSAGPEVFCESLDFLNSRKSTIEKKLFVYNNNMAYYQRKVKELCYG